MCFVNLFEHINKSKHTHTIQNNNLSFIFSHSFQLVKSEPNYADVLADALGDLQFLCPTFDAAEDMSAAGIPVYSYLMTHVPESSVWGKDMTWLGATHAEDIPYVFGSPFMLDRPDPDGESELIGLFNEQEIEMSKQMMKYWSNFAKTG